MALQPPSIRIHGTTATFVAEPGAEVLYTVDGKEPTMQSLVASVGSPVELGQRNSILKAVAVRGGERSSVASALYVYTPRPLVIVPEDGVYDTKVVVQFQSDHEDIRYTLDGTLPNKNSPPYEAPFVISQEGQTVVTAAMLVGDHVVGAVARRTYEVAQARLEPPVVQPPPGTLVAPVRIAVSSDDVVRYTLDNSEPTLSSSRYTAPIVLLREGEVTLKLKAFPRLVGHVNRRPSETVVAKYVLTMSNPDADAAGGTAGEEANSGQPVTVLPLSNVEFSTLETQMATESAEKAVGFAAATQQVKEELKREHQRLQEELRSSKLRHRSLLEELERVQRDLGIAAARKTVLHSQQAVQSELMESTNAKLIKLQQDHLDLEQRLFSVRIEVGEAERLLRHSNAEIQALHAQRQLLRRGLEESYLQGKKQLAKVNPHLAEEVVEAAAVVAEQRHEIWLLRETLESLHRSVQRPNPAASEFVPRAHVVDIPVVEAIIPIPRGKMRWITGPTGVGLHELREAHKVQASIVQRGDELAVRVHGHARGVHQLIEQLGRLLNE